VKDSSEDTFDARTRQPKAWAIPIKVICLLVPLLGVCFILRVQITLRLAIYTEQYCGLIMGLLLTLCFITRPATKKSRRDTVPWYDIIGSTASLAIGAYLGFFYQTQADVYISIMEPQKIVLGLIGVILVLEATRRTFGWPLLVLAVAFILYGRYTESLPGLLSTSGTSWNRLFIALLLDPGAMLGIPLQIATIMLLGFMLFGAFLLLCGGGKFITDFAFSIMGKYRGGPAKVAVVASGLFGTLSGSAVANAVSIGMVTIPMMKKAGYTSEYAAAVEAVASTGGCLMPPIMGAIAFLMAELLGISYAEVAIAAAFPAILYYVCLFIQIDLEAGKLVGKTIKRGWLTGIGFSVLVYSLFISGLSPESSAIYATAAIVIFSLLTKETRLSFRSFLSGLETTTRTMVDVVTVCAAAGIIIGITMMSGIGLLLSTVLLKITGGNVFLLLLLVAIISIFMGMGMPGIVSYVLLATLAAPALVKSGLNPIAVHMFIMYFGLMSFITPPVCIAIFVTSSIAGTASATRAGFRAMGLGVTAYLVPFIFVYDKGMLLLGPLGEIINCIVMGFMACLLLAVAIEGYLFDRLNVLKRVLICGAALFAIIPAWGWVSDVIGIAIILPIIANELRLRKTRQPLSS
jgi:TRAP transporter 4TM/12TM fusion protein